MGCSPEEVVLSLHNSRLYEGKLITICAHGNPPEKRQLKGQPEDPNRHGELPPFLKDRNSLPVHQCKITNQAPLTPSTPQGSHTRKILIMDDPKPLTPPCDMYAGLALNKSNSFKLKDKPTTPQPPPPTTTPASTTTL